MKTYCASLVFHAANDLEESVNINEAFETSIAIGAHAFSKMQGDIDKQRKQKMQRLKGAPVEYFEHQKRLCFSIGGMDPHFRRKLIQIMWLLTLKLC